MAVDQILSSGTNLLMLVLVLRTSSGSLFGAFGVALIVQGLVLGASRAAISEVLLLRLRGKPQKFHSDRHLAVTIMLIFGIAVGIVLASASFVAPNILHGFLMVMAFAIPFVVLQDLHRYLAFSVAQPKIAVSLDLVWLTVQVAGSDLVMLSTNRPLDFVIAWVTGAAASALAGITVMRWRPSHRGIGRLLLAERPRSVRFLADFALSTGVAQASFLGLAAVLTLEGFGLLRFALAVTSPFTNLLASARVLALGYFGRYRTPPRATWPIVFGGSIGYAGITLSFLGLLLVIPDRAGVAALGVLWPQAKPLLLLSSIAEAARVAQFTAIDFLKAFVSRSALLATRTFTGLLSAIGMFVGGVLAGPRGVLTALALANLIALLCWHIAAYGTYRTFRDASSTTETDRC